MPTLLPILACCFILFPPVDHPEEEALQMVEAAVHFLSLVSEDMKDAVAFPFETEERTNWNFVPIPGQRKGMPLDEMSHEQRAALHRLLQAALSAEGYLKVTAIQQLEQLLGQLEGRPDYRDPGHYYLSIFGTPSLRGAWGWRFEGHHLSINFAIVEGHISTTPAFMGTNPGHVKETVFSGLEVLSTEISLARELMKLFQESQLDQVHISSEAPRDIITGNSREALLDSYEGLPFKEMTAAQQDLLILLLSTYVHNLEPAIAKRQLKRIKDAGLGDMYFAWAGSLEDGEAHYFRIHGPHTLIEYDNTQNNANHVHTVWRDLQNDFGRDYLKLHYKEGDHDHD